MQEEHKQELLTFTEDPQKQTIEDDLTFEADPPQEEDQLNFLLPTPQQTTTVTNALDFLATLIDKSAKTSELMQSAVAEKSNDEGFGSPDERGGWGEEELSLMIEDVKEEGDSKGEESR